MKRSWIALLLVGGCIRIETVVQTESPRAPAVVFDVDVPGAPATLPVYPLHTSKLNPLIFDRLGPQANACRTVLDRPSKDGQSAEHRQADQDKADGEPRRTCRVDESTGDVEVYPDFKRLSASRTGATLDRNHALDLTRGLLERPERIATDDHTLGAIHLQLVLKHERAERAAPGSPDRSISPAKNVSEVMLFTKVKRQVNGLDVDGPGSRLIVASDDDGVQGFLRSWRSAGAPHDLKASRTRAEVHAEIERQLTAMKSDAPLHVRQIELSYYDGSAQLLQPVYRFVVEAAPTRRSLGMPEHFVGYVRYAETDEKVPELGTIPEDTPSAIPPMQTRDLDDEPIQLGAYITRDQNPDWRNDAHAFFHAIKASPSAGAFIIKQFYPASPPLFSSARKDYVNNVDIALIEAHGAPWEIATRGDCCDLVQLGTNPFGAGSATSLGPGFDHGRLQHLVLHSCNVVASPDETPRWAEPWWPVFQGLRTVVGYRTAMYINDGAGAAFGRSLGEGSAVLPAWFNAIASLNAYGRDPSLSFRCLGDQAMGRPAAISVCGEEDAVSPSVPHTTDPATCLDAWWIGDAINFY